MDFLKTITNGATLRLRPLYFSMVGPDQSLICRRLNRSRQLAMRLADKTRSTNILTSFYSPSSDYQCIVMSIQSVVYPHMLEPRLHSEHTLCQQQQLDYSELYIRLHRVIQRFHGVTHNDALSSLLHGCCSTHA